MADETFIEGSLGKWKLLSKIDAGGNSVVMLVEAPAGTGLLCSAAKIFTEAVKTGDRKARFIAEIETVKKLGNLKGCASLIDHGFFEDRPFYIMPYFKGGSLHDIYINRQTNEFDPVASLEQFLKVVENVKTLHSRIPALAVRDIKPKNILFDGAEPIICDFGLALWANTPTEDRSTKHAEAVGSIGYRPPEWNSFYPESNQTAGDIWSLGRVLWAICSGKNPPANYETTSGDQCHLSNFITDRKIANAIQGIINICTNYEAKKRPSAAELLDDIRTTLDFCKKETGVPTNLNDSLEKLKFTLSGSRTLAAAQIKKQEFDALFKEMEDAQKMLIDVARKFILPLEKMVRDRGAGAVFVGGLDRTTTGNNTVTVIIVYEPQNLRTKINHQVVYEFVFGLNSSNEFVWRENFQFDGLKFDTVFFNPRSLAVIAGQKAGQIESILQNTFIPKLTELLR